MAKNNLDALKKAWNKAKQEYKEFAAPHFEDGHYLTKISKATVGQSKKGSDQLTIDFTFIEGEYAGKIKKSWWSLDISNEIGLAMTLGVLARMGLEDVEPETLEADVQQLIGRLVRIRLTTKVGAKDGKEYQNIYIEKVLGVDPETADTTPVAEVGPEAEEEEELPEEKPAKPAKKSSKGSEEPEAEPEAEDDDEEIVEEAIAEEEDGVEISKGMKVSFAKKDGSELQGVIEEIDEENGKVVVKADVNGVMKKFRVDVDRLSAL